MPDLNEIQLKSFQFRLKEKFMYEYNFFHHWEIEIRIEKILPEDAKNTYPICIEGRRSGPPEDCGGPWAAFSKARRGREASR